MRLFRRRQSSDRDRRRRLVEQEREAYDQRREAAPKGAAKPRQVERGTTRGARSGTGLRRPRLSGLRRASASGARATVRQTGPGARRAGGALGHLAGRLAAWPMRAAAVAERGLLRFADGAHAFGARSMALLERAASTERVLVVVTIAAAGCLIASQFEPYRAIEVGQPQYAEVSAVAPAPQTGRVDAGEAHAYVLVPLAAAALVLAVAALVSGRWRLGRPVALIGVAGIAVSLAIDLPKGLDAGTAGVAFAGANATLIEGFYVQVASSAALVLCGWLLARYLRLASGAPASHGRSRGAATQGTPSVAGGGA